ncbi:hypothetical protein NA56DRAFT_710299 [Hyaloscypha hepaticicola]|uniref:Uncharacterized protein n=1 Tax=Hyaloscypha hepaticicola TaxID=2082293 RepID=A0A2J6PM05_9HELO|nr:hypothetical protein NA56DRAFT_710299 [Hyaloscypha hepaticicola]
MVVESFKKAASIPHILLKFLSAHNSTVPDKSMLNQNPSAIGRYTNLGWRLFRAILRRPQVLSPKMRAEHSRPYAALPNHSSGSGIPELFSFCIAVLGRDMDKDGRDISRRPE